MNARLQRAFTLLELLVVIAIFAVLSVLAYGGLGNFLKGRTIAAAQAARLAQLETAFIFIQQDIEAAVPRPVRDELGGPEPALRGGEGAPVLLELTRRAVNPAPQSARSDLRRIEYRVQGTTLVRRVWPMLDRPQDAKADEEILIDDIAAASIRFHSGTWQRFWPAAGDTADSAQLPRAIDIAIRFRDGRELDRKFLLAGIGGV